MERFGNLHSRNKGRCYPDRRGTLPAVRSASRILVGGTCKNLAHGFRSVKRKSCAQKSTQCFLPPISGFKSRKPSKMTRREAPVSAAKAGQSDVKPVIASNIKAAFTASAKQIFCRMMRRVRRECRASQESFIKSSTIKAMSAVSTAASLRAAPIAMPRLARPNASALLTAHELREFLGHALPGSGGSLRHRQLVRLHASRRQLPRRSPSRES